MSDSDQKLRWAGILENSLVSKWQRLCLDGGRVSALKEILRPYRVGSLLDVGCGLGECSRIERRSYMGLDNSFKHLRYAVQKYRDCGFVMGDAACLPFKRGAFDVSLLACAAHHLSDEQLVRVLAEMKRVSRQYLVIDDAVITSPGYSLRNFFYRLDRGKSFRRAGELEKIALNIKNVHLSARRIYRTFPGVYYHAVFILKIEDYS